MRRFEKLIVLLCFLPLLALSCSKESKDPTPGPDPSGETIKEIGASTKDLLLIGVKSHLGPQTDPGCISVCWDASDEIAVFSKAAGSSMAKFRASAADVSSDGRKAVFRGETSNEAPFSAVYPASALKSGNCDKLDIIIPGGQAYSKNNVARGANVAVAFWDKGTDVSFENVCAIFRIPVTGTETIGGIAVQDNDVQTDIWGDCSVKMEGESIKVGKCTNGGNSITVNCIPSVTLNPEKAVDFYVAVAPGSFANGFKLKLLDEEHKELRILASKTSYKAASGVLCLVSDLVEDKPFIHGGTGIETDPYIIEDAADLMMLSSMVNDRNSIYGTAWYRQTKDIDMKGATLSAIGKSAKAAFQGHYDGGNFKISNMKLTAAAGGTNVGLFGYVAGAEISNVNLEICSFVSTVGNSGLVVGSCNQGTKVTACRVSNSDISINTKGSGGVVGMLDGESTVEACNFIGGTISVKTGNKDDLSECAGIVGYVKSGHIKDCTFSGRITSDGERIAGITSALFGANSDIKGCYVTKEAVIKCNGSAECGGITGIVADGALVDGCHMDGHVLLEVQRAGGIAATLRKGTIRNCVVGPDAVITAIDTQAGGIAGAAYWTSNATTMTIENCLVCGNISGKARVGGIVGYYTNGNVGGDVLNIVNCGFDGGTLKATENLADGSDYYTDMGGIIGSCYLGTYDETVNIINCWASPTMMRMRPNQIPYGSETIHHTTSPRIGGLIGGQTGSTAGKMTVAGCYSDIAKFQIDFNGKEWPDTPTKHYGGLYGKCATSVNYDSDYCTLSIQFGPGYAGIPAFKCEQIGRSGVTDGTLLKKLNDFKAAYSGGFPLKNWVRGPEGRPILEGFNVPVSGKKRAPLRISIIGDSISTYMGWIPDGYHTYFPSSASSSLAGGMSLSKVSQTYWWRLAYDYMSNAVVEKNISWSGSLVSALKQKHFDEGGGSSNIHYFKRSFVERFIEQDGVGNPDIIIIKGGTNDGAKAYWNGSKWAGDGFALYVVDNAKGKVKNRSEIPSKAALDIDIEAGRAAKTYAEAKTLKDDSFSESYVKLIRLCQTKYPGVKIVCIVSDSIFDGFASTACYVATELGCKTVDLYRINGVKTYKNNLLMPKVDASNLNQNGNGTHPDPRGMDVVAGKIYSELGGWLEGAVYSDEDNSASNRDFEVGVGEW